MQDKVANILVGEYRAGYIYGNCKIHKNVSNPPVRPIISQIPSPTYKMSKVINDLIEDYLPAKYILKSTDELIDILRVKKPKGILTSLDVENLFTNVPIDETIQIILDNVYRNQHKVPPKIHEHTMKQLLEICTKEAPFQHINGDYYQQVDGIAMGSPLGCIFANFYMAQIENNIIPNLPKQPSLYARYVDDILLIVDSASELDIIKNTFNCTSSLNFTSENGGKILPFLDVLLEYKNETINTSVYTKPTNSGHILNYNSECPIKYKKGVINTMLLRAHKICSTPYNFESEIHRLKQLFTNNNYPMQVIDECITKFQNKLTNNRTEPPNLNDGNVFKVYYNNQMNMQYLKDEKAIKDIINNNIKTTNAADKIQLIVYYNSRKTKNLIMKNKIATQPEPSSTCWAVYEVSCPYGDCELLNPSYIGQTRNTLKTRLQQHMRDGAIRQHIETFHNTSDITLDALEKNAKIVKQFQDFRRLTIYEALLILTKKPQMNRQIDNFINPLKLYGRSGTPNMPQSQRNATITTLATTTPTTTTVAGGST